MRRDKEFLADIVQTNLKYNEDCLVL